MGPILLMHGVVMPEERQVRPDRSEHSNRVLPVPAAPVLAGLKQRGFVLGRITE
jgi:hypothetical protein